MGTIISKGLVSGSIDDSLEEIDLRSQDPGFLYKDEIRVGPFAVLHFKSAPSSGGEHTDLALEKPTNSTHTPASNHDVTGFDIPSYRAINTADCAGDLLQWSDLFSDDFYGSLPDSSFDPGNPLDFQSFSQMSDTYPGTGLSLEDVSLQFPNLPQTLSPVNILGDASFLLKNFQKNIIPQMTVVPLAKSPWNILNVPAALVTLGELTIMESESVSHARQANLYSLLACSAVHLAMDSSTETIGLCPRNHWKEVSEQAYQRANTHMKMSLSEETGGARKAKLKDQLMAIYGLTEFAVSSHIILQFQTKQA
jgi:arginine metabolism regulation protein II